MKRLILIAASAAYLAFAAGVKAQTTMPLYSGDIPNQKKGIGVENVLLPNQDSVFSQVLTPTLTVYRPDAAVDKHCAIVVCPGGGYQCVCYGWEGSRIGKALAKRGITAFSLCYRLPNAEHQDNPYIAPLQDAQQALRYVRENADRYGIDPHKIGTMGFSAGGHLASTLGTHYGKSYIDNPRGTSLRPDFMVLVYPVISMRHGITHSGSAEHLAGSLLPEDILDLLSNEQHVTADTPPAFLVQGTDDKIVPVKNSLLFYEAMIAHNRPAEMHLYGHGEHGFPSTPTLDEWMGRMTDWLKLIKIFD